MTDAEKKCTCVIVTWDAAADNICVRDCLGARSAVSFGREVQHEHVTNMLQLRIGSENALRVSSEMWATIIEHVTAEEGRAAYVRSTGVRLT